MYNYHTDLIWSIDRVLLLTAFFLSVAIFFYMIIRAYLWNKRSKALLSIKRDVYGLTLSGKELSDKVCLPASSEATLQQFLDVATNRNREAIFFNEAEQKIFKNCFISPEKITRIEKTARGSWNKWDRIEAILSLGYAESGGSIPTLKKSLNDRDRDISYFSILALGQIKTPLAAKILLEFLKKHKFYRRKIVSILETFPSAIASEVVGLAENKDQDVRSWVAILLAKLKAGQYVKNIEKLTSDESEEVRAAACESLGDLGNKEARPLLVKLLKNDMWLVRLSAVKALSRLLGKESLSDIVASVNDPSLSVIEAVKDAMAEHIDAAMPYIENFMSGKDEVAKRVALEALELSRLFRKHSER